MIGDPGRFSKKIPPYKWTTLSVGLKAPANNGTYTASWRFTDGNGKAFGANLPVEITVKKNPDPTATTNATQVSTDYTAIAQTAAAAATAAAATAAQGTAVSIGQTAVAQTATAQSWTATPTPTP
jgi:hypothetical protein